MATKNEVGPDDHSLLVCTHQRATGRIRRVTIDDFRTYDFVTVQSPHQLKALIKQLRSVLKQWEAQNDKA